MRVPSHLLIASSLAAFVAASTLVAPSAFAQDPQEHQGKPQPPAVSPPPLPQPTSAQPVIVVPAPQQAAASAPSSSPSPITATCQLGDHPGIDESEARVGADVVCHELAKQHATNGQHEVRFGRLGGRTLVTVASRNGNSYDDRRTFINGMDEINVASPRLVSALVDNKPFDETKTVDTVLSSETRPPKVQNGSMGMDAGLFGTTTIGKAPAGTSGGISLALMYRAERFAVSSTGRAGGVGSSDAKMALASIDIGARYYLSASDIAPFVGGGFVLGYYKLYRTEEHRSPLEASGVGGYVQVGMELLRTHHTAFAVSLRADTPFFKLKASSRDDGEYIVPTSLNVSMLFH